MYFAIYSHKVQRSLRSVLGGYRLLWMFVLLCVSLASTATFYYYLCLSISQFISPKVLINKTLRVGIAMPMLDKRISRKRSRLNCSWRVLHSVQLWMWIHITYVRTQIKKKRMSFLERNIIFFHVTLIPLEMPVSSITPYFSLHHCFPTISFFICFSCLFETAIWNGSVWLSMRNKSTKE